MIRQTTLQLLALLMICTGLRPGGASAYGQQIGTSISADGSAPNNNAMLDVQSPATGDGKGLLIPRISYTQRTTSQTALAGGLLNDSGQLRGGPAHGLLVYQTNGQQGLYYNTSQTATPTWSYVGDFLADGTVPMSGRLNMSDHSITNIDALSFSDKNVQLGNGAQAYSSSSGSVAIGAEATARYRIAGIAIGTEADGDYNGIGIGYQADGQYSNIAIGFAASSYSGYDRITIGRSITNRRNDSCAIRGSLYLDGGTGVMYRSTCGAGTWQTKAFTIDHPLDPENKVLRHFCLEGPEVWNVYAGQTHLVNGRATVALPDYYSALNKPGSEVFSLTVLDNRPDVFPQVKISGPVLDNHFVILGTHDVPVHWSVKTLRNDPGCLEDLLRRPVEQSKSELAPGQAQRENAGVNTPTPCH